MRPPNNSWPNTPQSGGILFFAQLMREMLTDQSFESFRAYSLGSIARLDEAIIVADEIRRRSLRMPPLVR